MLYHQTLGDTIADCYNVATADKRDVQLPEQNSTRPNKALNRH